MTGSEHPYEGLDVLCRRLAASDRDALEQIFRRLREDLVRYVTSIIRDGMVAHDLVQDVFVALWDRRAALDPALSLKSYLYQMARNRAYHHLRDRRTHEAKHRLLRLDARTATLPGEAPDAYLGAETLDRKIRRWIEDLPERQREALVLSRYHELSHREIAAVMDISPRTVNNHIVRALTSLQRCLREAEPTLFAP